MAIDKSGEWWKGSEAGDLAEYLREFRAGGYEVADIEIVGGCRACGSADGYRLRVDDEEGYAERSCVACRDVVQMLDSAQYADSANPGDAACPCGGEVFDLAVGFALREDGDVRWVSIGLRCRGDDTLGCYADWKIDYSPTDALRANV